MTEELTDHQYALRVAHVVHEANRAWRAEWAPGTEVPHWEDLTTDMIRTNVEGVLQAIAGATPEQMHAWWLSHMEGRGWVHGATKDPEALTHPSMVPYEDLPKMERELDVLFQAIVAALADGQIEQRLANLKADTTRFYQALIVLYADAATAGRHAALAGVRSTLGELFPAVEEAALATVEAPPSE